MVECNISICLANKMYGEHLWSTIRFSFRLIVSSGIRFCGQKRLTARNNVRAPGLIWETGGLSDKSAQEFLSDTFTQLHTDTHTIKIKCRQSGWWFYSSKIAA